MAVKELVTQVEAGRRLGVDRRQVFMWGKRRGTNGFPRPVKVIVEGGRSTPLYDWARIEKWHAGYVPANGGRRKVV